MPLAVIELSASFSHYNHTMPLSKRSMEDCFCEDDYLCNNCEDEWIKKSSNQLASNGKICTVAELKELYEANPFGTRYQLVALIASKIWTTSVKSSVWIEDPSRKNGEKRQTTTIAGKEILESFLFCMYLGSFTLPL